jgi:hypothetical protein
MKVIARGPNFIAHGPDEVDQTVVVNGKVVHFDFDRRFGPLLTDAHGEPLKRQPVSENHPFWAPFNAWLAVWLNANPDPAKLPDHTDHLDRSMAHQAAPKSKDQPNG